MNNELIKNSLVSLVFCFSLLLLNIKLFEFSGFAVTGALFFLCYFFLVCIKSFSLTRLLLLLVFCVLLLSNATIQIKETDLEQFFRSFCLTLCFCVIYFYSFCNGSLYINRKVVHFFIFASTFCVIGFELLQLFEQFFFKSHDSWFYLASISTSTADDVGRFQDARFLSYMRPISIYYEPSFLGFVLFLLYAINSVVKVSSKLRLLLAIGILFSLSASMIFFFIIFIIIESSKSTIGVIIMSAIAIFFIMAVIFLFPDVFRLNEIFAPGTSGHERLVKPFLITEFYLINWPFGLALGQSSVMFNNSLFLLVLYFGIFFPFLILFKFIFLYLNLNDSSLVVKYFILLLALLFLNGALFTFEGAFFIFLINYFLSVKRNYGILD